MLSQPAEQSDLYREMGWGGPLHGSNWWKLRQFLTRGRIYDARDFMRHMEWFAKGLTFREAYEKTGRVLTISATPVRSRGRRAVPLQLNHISTPHVDIASAVCASSCVPGLIEPVELLEKGPDGTLRPYHMADEGDERIAMRDGSFESDVPLEALAATFGATFTIVSQVSVHVAHLRFAHPYPYHCAHPQLTIPHHHLAGQPSRRAFLRPLARARRPAIGRTRPHRRMARRFPTRIPRGKHSPSSSHPPHPPLSLASPPYSLHTL